MGMLSWVGEFMEELWLRWCILRFWLIRLIVWWCFIVRFLVGRC